MARGNGWIGVDFDGTLAYYDGYDGPFNYGAPIPKMVERVKGWLAEGKRVKIFTARVSEGYKHNASQEEQDLSQEIAWKIGDWCEEYLGQRLEVTCVKDRHMYVLYDDRAKQVVPNTGQVVYKENT